MNHGLTICRFTLEWSTVELDQSEYWVCENAGRLEVVVRRRGTNATHVTANIRAKSLSARGGLDFISSSDGLLIFPPGHTLSLSLTKFLQPFNLAIFTTLSLFNLFAVPAPHLLSLFLSSANHLLLENHKSLI